MLDTLDSIDWDKLGIPHIPALLRDLTSNDPSLQEKAWSRIGETLIPWTLLEGVRRPSELLWFVSHDALYATIPFMIELLSYAAVTCKDLILDLLNDIARYVEADMFMPREPQSEKQLYRTHARRAYNAVYEGKSMYQKLTEDANPKVVEIAVHILRVLDELKGIMEGWSDKNAASETKTE